MTRLSIGRCLPGIAFAFLLVAGAAQARAQGYSLAANVDRTGSALVTYMISGAPPSVPFTVLASIHKGPAKVGGWSYQGSTVPMFQLALGLPVRQLVVGTTDAKGGAKASLRPQGGFPTRLKQTTVYFQSFAVRISPAKPQPIIQVFLSNLVVDIAR